MDTTQSLKEIKVAVGGKILAETLSPMPLNSDSDWEKLINTILYDLTFIFPAITFANCHITIKLQ